MLTKKQKIIIGSLLAPFVMIPLIVGVVWIINPLVVSEGWAYLEFAVTGKSRVSGLNAEKIDVDGIDVSHHNGRIQWKEVAKNKKIKFVYVKATQGVGYVDSYYKRNKRDALRAGLEVGVYHFFTSKRSGKQQFEFFRKTVGRNPGTLIPMVDVEPTGIGNMSAADLQRELTDFCEMVKKVYGRRPIIYVSNGLYNRRLHGKFDRYYIWISRYGFRPRLPRNAQHQIWQFSEHGKVNGIYGYTDLNTFSGDMTLEKLKM